MADSPRPVDSVTGMLSSVASAVWTRSCQAASSAHVVRLTGEVEVVEPQVAMETLGGMAAFAAQASG